MLYEPIFDTMADVFLEQRDLFIFYMKTYFINAPFLISLGLHKHHLVNSFFNLNSLHTIFLFKKPNNTQNIT
jgi:hypothetical protein